MQAGFENFLAIPGVFLVYLRCLASESIATLKFKTRQQTEKAMEAKDLWDMDLRDTSPVSKALED